MSAPTSAVCWPTEGMTSSSVIRRPAWSRTSSAAGSAVEVVTGARNLAEPEASQRLVSAAIDRFGRIDAAAAFTGHIVIGKFLKSSVEDLRSVLAGCVEGPYNFLRAVIPVLVGQGEGQVLVFTSAAGARVTPGAPLYSSARAGANMLVRNVAAEVASKNVQVNAMEPTS